MNGSVMTMCARTTVWTSPYQPSLEEEDERGEADRHLDDEGSGDESLG